MKAYCSVCGVERKLLSRLRYSVLRSQVTCGRGVGVEVPEPEGGWVIAKEPNELEGSSSKNWSLGSSCGRFAGSGLSSTIYKVAYLYISKSQRHGMKACHAPEASASCSHKHSHFPRSSGMPHSASTIMGSGVSFAISFRNSGRA